MKRRQQTGCLILVFGLLVTIIIADRVSRLPDRDGAPPDLSGTYVFDKRSCLNKFCFISHPDFSLDSIPDGETITITQDENSITIEHYIDESKYANWDINQPMVREFLFDNSMLNWDSLGVWHKRVDWGVMMGIGRHYQVVKFSLDNERSLIVESESGEAGLGLFVLPFTESITSSMKLVRTGEPE